MTLNKSRRALGRGLSVLIPFDQEETTTDIDNRVTLIPIEKLSANPFQPRQDFNEEEIQGLAESIKAQGLLQPLLARQKDDAYEIISGERRFRALKLLGHTTAPCIVKIDITDVKMLELALVENVQRENLNEIELAQSYQKLLFECGLSHQELSERVGKSRTVITNTLRLLKLPEDLQKMLRNGTISMGHARALVGIEDTAQQQTIAERIVAEGLSVRETERIIQSQPKGSRPVKTTNTVSHTEVTVSKRVTDPDVQSQQDQLRYHFGTDVRITIHTDGSGTISIYYYNSTDFNRIVDMLRRD
ncbi:MAG: ParB/RepB/Spo0J family partition protein [Chitinivibrionales bacterium]|nr:ParB/RepB/Spo0J family partition protein [Chitinivibrionales bacterium]